MQAPFKAIVFLAMCLAIFSGSRIAEAAPPKIRMKMELVSIRNRSAGPVPVRIRLEYNDPQFLEGSLELQIHDAIGFPDSESRILTLRRDDIVLAGQDYEFILLMPPMNPPETRNWSIRATFVTENERIPLSFRPERMNPPEPFELLVTSFMERGMVLCSASEDPVNQPASANRLFLESALSLDNYNPHAEKPVSPEAAMETAEARRDQLQTGKTVVFFASPWSARSLPDDPLTHCSFDGVLLSDGGLAQLNSTQLEGLKIWVRAGGSLCVIPDGRLQPMHLEFLRTACGEALGAESDLTLDSEGKLLLIHEDNEPILKAHFGLGRVVLLPLVENLQARLAEPAALGEVVAFLWKVRSDSPIWQGQKWNTPDGLAILKQQYPGLQQDERGCYISYAEYLQHSQTIGNVMGPTTIQGDRVYFDSQLQASLSQPQDLFPQTGSGMARLETSLLPVDVEMVPTSVIALILIGYVLAIGPVDYFVLGWLKMRKYTWIAFPVVTLLFTFLTIAVANQYMGSEDTGGYFEITDLDQANTPVRQSRFETMFYGRSGEAVKSHRLGFFVQASDQTPPDDWIYGNRQTQTKVDEPLEMSGTFPQNYKTVQSLAQWSPVTFRAFTLTPENVVLPEVNWNDVSLVETPEGRIRLANLIRELSARNGSRYAACVIHGGTGHIDNVVENLFQPVMQQQERYFMYGYADRSTVLQQAMSQIVNAGLRQDGFFSIVSQIAPEGAPLLEDLAMFDASDPTQKVLVICKIDGNRVQMFRKRFFVEAPL